jgi:hypothetical protein
VIKAAAVESAIRAMVKNPSLKMQFKDLGNYQSDPVRTAPIQNKLLKLSKVTSLPDLVPYAIWNSGAYPIIVRNTPATSPYVATETDSSPLNDNDSTLISLCVANLGDDAAVAFSVKVYIDAQLLWTENFGSLNGWYLSYTVNRYVGSISAGTHTLKMVVDSDGEVSEGNEANNEYTRSITVSHVEGVPCITSILPSSVSAGTGSTVTITGTGFGATQGSSVVEFFYQSGHSKIIAPVNSWSDTQIGCTVPIGTVDGYAGSAGSGPVTVRTASGVSGGYDVNVTFAYGEVKWGASSTTYKINENYGPIAGEGAAVQAAFTTWNNGGALFSLQYGGATSITASGRDYTNVILWGITSGSLATNYYWYSGSTLLESDIVFDNSYTWGVGSDYDIQSIATHELGHSLNLRDQYGNGDLAEIMYGQGESGEIKRNLTSAETAGIQWIYGLLPVELTSFAAMASAAGAALTWTTATEVNNYGFEIERRIISNHKITQSISDEWLKIGFVEGNGTSNSLHSYSYTDNSVTSGRYAYRLKQIDNDGAFKYSDEAEVTFGIPSTFTLNQNYPNPFNPTTKISYSLPEAVNVHISVFDLLGREIISLLNEEQQSGNYSVDFNAGKFGSGIYFYRIQAGNMIETKKMIFMK